MGTRGYPTLHCTECGEVVRLVAVCEKPGSQTETRFYECSNPVCRDSFRSCVPVIRAQEWIGIGREIPAPKIRPH